MRTLPGIGLTAFFGLGFDGWDDEMDGNIRLCSALIQGRALDLVATEPGSPTDGDIVLLDETNATHANAVAIRDNGGWVYVTPLEGWRFYDVAGGVDRRFDAVRWAAVAEPTLTVDNDTTLASDSTTNAPSVHAVKTAIANAVTGLLEWKGATDCSANPNYPAASKGDSYTVSVAGKIGGASGSTVDVGDVFIATADNAGGTQASVGASWVILEHNLVSALAASFATAAEIQAGTASSKVIAPDQLAVAAEPQALTDGATVAWDMSAGFNAKVTIAGNRTLTVSNPKKGITYSLGVTQDTTGSRTVTWPSSFDWGTTGAPTLTTTASKRDRITLFCTDATTPKFDAFLSGKGFS